MRTDPCATAVNPSPIPASSQIFTNYGKSNEDLLMNHGFVVPDNPNDTYGFYFGRSFKVTPRMRRIMKDKGMDHRKRFEFTKEGDVPEDMHYYMRTKLLDGEGSVSLVKAIASLTPLKI